VEASKHSYNEYVIMTEIIDNENVSQRELSRKLGLSVGTVNILINKMIKEGMIKMNLVSQKQVMYMLTPVGVVEKAKKTVSYLKGHYRAIYETKEKVKLILDELNLKYENIFILNSNDEMGELIKLATTEYKSENKQKNKQKKIKIINENLNEYQNIENTVLLYTIENEEIINELLKIDSKKNNVKVINLFEKL
jgi:DNA-binding MarR family transcriptional regulator